MATIKVTDNIEDVSLSGLVNGTEMTFDDRKRQLEKIEKMQEEVKEREKKSIFRNFAQLNRDNIKYIRALQKINPNAVSVLMFIIENMDKMNALVCSYRVMQEQLELGRTTISNAIKTLKENNFIYIYKSGTSNIYVLSTEIAWTNTGDKAEYCKFPASIMLAKSEQEEMIKAKDQKKTKYTYNKILEEQEVAI